MDQGGRGHSFVEPLEQRLLMRVLGVDVSQFQGSMDWSDTWNQGGRFAFIRASRSDTVPDSQVNNFVPAAKSQGLLVGVYHRALPFSNTADTGAFRDPIVDADAFIAAGGAYMGDGFMRPVLDIENGASLRDNPVNGYNLSQWAVAFINRIKEVKGVEPLVYANGNYARNYLDSSVAAATPDLWIARWNNPFPNPHTDQPQDVSGWPNLYGHWNLNGYNAAPHPDSWKFWQYSAGGNGLGATWGAGSVDIDLDVWNGDNINVLKQNFVTGAADIPTLASPANGATGISPENVTLDWNDSAGAVAYDLFLDGVEVASDITSSDYTLATTLTAGAHNWYVVAKGVLSDDDTHVAGDTWAFTTEGAPELPGIITGALFNDLDADAVRDAGEPALEGRTVWLDADNDSVRDIDETSAITNSLGQYSFTVDPGTYTVRQVLPSGWYQTVPSSNAGRIATVAAGETVTLFAFGSALQTSTITGALFHDLDADATLDAGEPALAGRTVWVDADSDAVFDSGERSAVTDSTGRYTLTVAPGTHLVRQVLPSGWYQTVPVSNGGRVVTVAAGATATLFGFGSAQFATISGALFHDLNGNAARETDEPILANRTVWIDRDNDAVFDSGEPSAVTNALGQYTFTVAPGSYTVRQVLPANWYQTVPSNNGGRSITVVAGAVETLFAFGSTQFATITGTVFHDVNANAALNTGEPGIGGRTVWIDTNNNSVFDAGESSMITDSAGRYGFTVTPGTYTVRQVLPDGWYQTVPFNNGGRTTSIASGGVINQPAFGSAQLARINGALFHDLNGDARWDADESSLESRTVWIDTDNDAVVDNGEQATVTDAAGRYSFAVRPGTYTIRQVLPSGWYQTIPLDNAGAAATVTAGASVDLPAFGSAAFATLSGTLFHDLNGDAALDANEPMLEGRTVWIDADDDAVFDEGESSTVTDTAGGYHFTVRAGNYIVRQLLPDNWYQTVPSGDAGQAITIASGGAINLSPFGATQYASITGALFHDLNGDAVLDAVEPALSERMVWIDSNNNGILDTDENSAVTDSAGRYSFIVKPGTYTVRQVLPETWYQTVPSNDAGWTATVVSGSTVELNAFSATQFATISGALFHDLNADAALNSNEPLLSGRMVWIDKDNDAVLDADEASCLTDSAGRYSFTVTPGTYTVRQILPDGWYQTVPASDAGRTTIVASGGSENLFAFGSARFGSISGSVFRDRNGNGVFDHNDFALPGWTVYLDADRDGALDSGERRTTTDSGGNWTFTGLVAGTYTVRVLPAWDYRVTTPPADSFTHTLFSGTTITDDVFGLRP